jgi:protein TonB
LLSLLLHFLLLLSFVTVLQLSPVVKPEPKPSMYIPSYAVNLPTPPTPVQQPQQQQMQPKKEPVPPQKPVEKMKAQTDRDVIATEKETNPTPKTASSTAAPKTSKYKPIDNADATVDEQAVHLIGDKKTEDPLIKLLGKAISARLVYPRSAVDFNLHGTSYIGFTLHPNGELTGIRVVQSSGADVLDDAALRGIQAISPLGGANQYVPKERFLVVGIIFK